MSKLAKRENWFPIWTNDLFDTGKFLSPRLFDFDGDAFDFGTRLPSVNVKESEKEYEIEMAAPGLERKDFKVEVKDGVLYISSEKEEENKEEKKNYTRREYSYNSFSRSFNLPDNCLTDNINAKYDNGILHLTLPKKEMTIAKSVKEIVVS
jgi:HSP20 family protein